MNLKIFTPEDWQLYSDMYKDAYGFRPRYFPFNTMEEFQTALKSLDEEISRQIEEQEAREKADVVKFEAKISDVMTTCNCSGKRAFEILMDAEESSYGKYDMDYFLYGWGISGKDSYDLINKFKREK